MPVYIIGSNEEILNSLIPQIPGTEIRIFTNGQDLMNAAEKVDAELPMLVLFDINIPINNFDRMTVLFRNKFPHASIWAIFDSKSEVLRNKLHRWGFEKIISYQDDLNDLISGFDSHR